MRELTISKVLAERVQNIALSCIECDVCMEEKNNDLWTEIVKKVNEISINLKVEDISKIQSIASSRKAYKTCGKDPARYRLSAEALLRRAVKRNEIYQINNVVDLLNLVSITTGFSIGGYDADKIEGDAEFGIGINNELYIGIGRGELNIENMPVFRDEMGAFGNSTSDSQRTSVSLQTNRFLMIIVDYNGTEEIDVATELAVNYLKKYAGATNFEIENIIHEID